LARDGGPVPISRREEQKTEASGGQFSGLKMSGFGDWPKGIQHGDAENTVEITKNDLAYFVPLRDLRVSVLP
jgi:hypothetical protein